MNKKLKYIIDIFVTLFLIFACYNLIPGKLQDFNYPIVMLAVSFHTYFVLRFFSFSLKESFFTILVVNLLIDASTLVTGSELIPLRFPFASIFPIVGFILGVLIYRKAGKLFSALLIFSCLFLFFSYHYLVPKILLSMQLKEIDNNTIQITKRLLNYAFLDKDSSVKKLELSNNCVTLVDFYFVGCGACVDKMIALDSISKTCKDKIKIICICNGKISSFQKFRKNLLSKNEQIQQLYCPNFDMGEINGYPFEILYNKRQEIISSQLGYNPLSISSYLLNLQKIINK